jgi:RNA polymerase sigma factor (sigma-70 family)
MYSSTAEQRRRAGVQALAATLYRERYHYLLAIARRNTANNADAEEALQDAFILFIDHFDPSGEAPPLAWLTLTLKRRCWAIRQSQMQKPNGEIAPQRRSGHVGGVVEDPADHGPLPEEIAEVDEAVGALRAGLGELKPDERRALALFALGYSYQEIAENCKWTYTKVNRCIREGRAALRARRAQES